MDFVPRSFLHKQFYSYIFYSNVRYTNTEIKHSNLSNFKLIIFVIWFESYETSLFYFWPKMVWMPVSSEPLPGPCRRGSKKSEVSDKSKSEAGFSLFIQDKVGLLQLKMLETHLFLFRAQFGNRLNKPHNTKVVFHFSFWDSQPTLKEMNWADKMFGQIIGQSWPLQLPTSYAVQQLTNNREMDLL